MKELELVSFQIISNVGVAKSCYVEAMRLAEKENYDQAMEKIKEGDQSFLKGHEAHTSLIQKEATGETVIPTMLLMHAEDQLISTETIKIMCQEIIRLNKELNDLKIKN